MAQIVLGHTPRLAQLLNLPGSGARHRVAPSQCRSIAPRMLPLLAAAPTLASPLPALPPFTTMPLHADQRRAPDAWPAAPVRRDPDCGASGSDVSCAKRPVIPCN